MIKKFVIALIIVVCCLSGCIREGRVEFVNLVRNHNELSKETGMALISSIDDRVTQTTDNEELKYLQDLKDRLLTIIIQSELIEEWVVRYQVDEQLIIEMINSVWKDK